MTQTVLSLWKGEIPAHETMAAIAARVAERHGLTIQQIKSPSRSRKVTWPRHEAMFEMARAGRWSTTQIGRFFDGMDHSTVIYGCEAHLRRELEMPAIWREVSAGGRRPLVSRKQRSGDREAA